MKKFVGLGHAAFAGLASIGLALLLTACGGGGGSAGDPILPSPGTGTGNGSGNSGVSMTLALSSTTVTAAAPATVSATIKDATGAAIPGQVVAFSTSASLGSFSATSALTDANGVASVSLSPAASSSTGADTVVATATVKTAALTASAGFQLTATDVTITSFVSDVATLAAYGQTTLTVSLSGTSAASPVNVVLASSCVTNAKATLTPGNVTTSTGRATFTYRDNGCGAIATTDSLQASVTGTSITRALSLGTTSPAVASISFSSATPETIYLSGSGFVENSNVRFQVKDANGNGVPNQSVLLEPTTLAGGLKIDGGSVAVTKVTDGNGDVLVRINSGTVPTPVRVKATLVGSNISTVSSNLAIAIGLPSQLNFSLSQGTRNIEGFNIDGTTNTYQIIASDRLGNPVPVGTAINFVSEGGQVEAIKMTALSNGLARATANFISASPRPADGRVTVVAYALGEESFLDINGNNVYDPGEDYQDLGDVFLDRLFNNAYNAAEDQFFSLSLSGAQACLSAASDILKVDATIPSRPGSCVAGWGRAYVRRAVETVFSTSSARPLYGTRLPSGSYASTCPLPTPLTTSYDAAGAAIKTSFYPFGSVGVYNLPAAGVMSLIAADANPVSFNPMAAGTVIAASATDGLTVNVVGGSPVPSSNSPTNAAVNYKFETASSGTITMTFTSPSGFATAVPVFVSTQAAPGTLTLCP